jgi:hypothetical protein
MITSFGDEIGRSSWILRFAQNDKERIPAQGFNAQTFLTNP